MSHRPAEPPARRLRFIRSHAGAVRCAGGAPPRPDVHSPHGLASGPHLLADVGAGEYRSARLERIQTPRTGTRVDFWSRSIQGAEVSERNDAVIREPSNRGLHRDVVTTLGRKIVNGELEPGDILTMERLEETMSVSRTVLREAVRVLSSKGLLDARPKRGTIVRPRSEWSLLDPDIMSWHQGDNDDTNQHLLLNLEEVRKIIEPQVARLAATRRNEADLAEMQSALEGLSTSLGIDRRRTAHYVAADLRFHRAMLSAAHNEILSQLSGVMENALRRRDALVYNRYPTDDASFVDLHRAVFDAIGNRDEERAERTMNDLLAQASRVLEQVLQLGERTAGADH